MLILNTRKIKRHALAVCLDVFTPVKQMRVTMSGGIIGFRRRLPVPIKFHNKLNTSADEVQCHFGCISQTLKKHFDFVERASPPSALAHSIAPLRHFGPFMLNEPEPRFLSGILTVPVPTPKIPFYGDCSWWAPARLQPGP